MNNKQIIKWHYCQLSVVSLPTNNTYTHLILRHKDDLRCIRSFISRGSKTNAEHGKVVGLQHQLFTDIITARTYLLFTVPVRYIIIKTRAIYVKIVKKLYTLWRKQTLTLSMLAVGVMLCWPVSIVPLPFSMPHSSTTVFSMFTIRRFTFTCTHHALFTLHVHFKENKVNKKNIFVTQ